MDVTANQDEISDHETFQLEFEPSTKRWYMRTMKDKYFTLQPGGGVQANENKRQVTHTQWQMKADRGRGSRNPKSLWTSHVNYR